ncbi:ubiquitin carboxyl-terminal hydrolase 37-like isoform X2 [Simochromis diagramma]|uniref:ubiquitin carboxyl-terminal hydrolase 37-like isoform X2 n=1 Tax=Simochromis diagramma TaxID=43689 RepID=UPI001A7E5E58|nr:ubiquitin carboxyl-terminal hydrolase 37-like isoform X2 [Simochromis diagramma]
MFKRFFLRKRSKNQNVAEKEIPSTSQQSVPDASVAATTPNHENGIKKKKKIKWRHFFCCFSETDSDTEAETNTVKPQKKSRWSIFKFWKRRRQVAPETTGEPDKKSDKLKNLQQDCTPAEAAPPKEDCLETKGQDLVASETTGEPDKKSDKLKNMQQDCTPAEAAPPKEDCLETKGQDLVASETTGEPDKKSDKLKNMQHDCTPAEAAPPKEDCLETKGQELDVKPPLNSSEDLVQVITTDNPSSTHKECGESSNQVRNTTEHNEPSDLSWDTLIMEFLAQEDVLEQVFDILGKNVKDRKKMENKVQTVDRFGFPNIVNSCYMNSCLQSLLNNEEFIRDVSRQETLWRAVPEARLLRRLMNIRDCHESRDYDLKKRRLISFKKAFSKLVPEYKGSAQKDAHEFLTMFLNEVKSLSPHLKREAALLGQSYTCPVEGHHVFKMENMRTCKSCGHQSSQQEEFTSLSLDLVPEGSVEDMLGTYLKEQKIEFTCDCGGTTSEVKPSFDTLPRVLIFHLKRFGFTQTYKLQKVNDPVRLQRDLVVSSKQGDGRYELISIISHYGGTESGHYICHSVHPEESPQSTSDHWLTYNDARVLHTTGSAVF